MKRKMRGIANVVEAKNNEGLRLKGLAESPGDHRRSEAEGGVRPIRGMRAEKRDVRGIHIRVSDSVLQADGTLPEGELEAVGVTRSTLSCVGITCYWSRWSSHFARKGERTDHCRAEYFEIPGAVAPNPFKY